MLPYTFEDPRADEPLRVVVIGAGMFGAGIVAQSARVTAMHVCAIADANLEAARRAFNLAGARDVAVCTEPGEARRALEHGKRVITTHADILFDQPIDAVVEATGIAEAGARHALAAIEAGKHVAMVTKETDAAVGPILRHLADRAGVSYLPVAGDQHGLLISLVNWARSVGLEVLSGGKAIDDELIVQMSPWSIASQGRVLSIHADAASKFRPGSASPDVISERARLLGAAEGAKPWDLTELAIAANATGLMPDVPAVRCPALWTTEIPAAMCSESPGGLLTHSGVVDAVKIIRHPHEAGLGGGVWVVVAIAGESARKIFLGKGAVCNPAGTTALIVHPQHLMGIEAIRTILDLPNRAARRMDYSPRVDVVYVARQNLPVGTILGDDHSPAVTARLLPASVLPELPLPAGLAHGNRLASEVSAGALINRNSVKRPGGSILWKLRDDQDAHFSRLHL